MIRICIGDVWVRSSTGLTGSSPLGVPIQSVLHLSRGGGALGALDRLAAHGREDRRELADRARDRVEAAEPHPARGQREVFGLAEAVLDAPGRELAGA